MRTAAELLAAYDDQLRTDAEVATADRVVRIGPLHVGVYGTRRGFITYRDLGGADEAEVRELVRAARDFVEQRTEVAEAEWKSRGHDRAPDLHDALVDAGFVPDEPESIMLGEARLLAVDLPLPDGVRLRTVTEDADVRAMSAMQDEVFGDPVSSEMADEVIRRLAATPGMELWIAEAGDEIISAGRLEPVADSDFASIWGGATRPQWRGRGIYRAMTAARARAALAAGKTLMHSDSTEFSRPILERSGFLRVSTTTPYTWHRA